MSKKSFGKNLENFFEGKGFYIVLMLCAGVISVSAWVLVTGTNVNEPIGDVGYIGAEVTPEVVKITPAPEQTEAEAGIIELIPVETAVILPEAEEEVETATVDVWTGAEPSLFVRPVTGEVINAHSMDVLVFNETMQDWRVHDGIDISAVLGEHVLAISAGEVTDITSDTMYGTMVTIAHAAGVESVYANLASVPTVEVGDTVVAGQVIGAVGDTALGESAMQTHLHLSMREGGNPVNPEVFLP